MFLGIAPVVGAGRGRLLERVRDREEADLPLGALCGGRGAGVVEGGLAGTLFFRSGQIGFHAWWLPRQFGHFAVTVMPLRYFSVQSCVGCCPAHIPHVSLPWHIRWWCPKRLHRKHRRGSEIQGRTWKVPKMPSVTLSGTLPRQVIFTCEVGTLSLPTHRCAAVM